MTDGNVEAVTVANGEVIAGGHYQNFCDPGTNCADPGRPPPHRGAECVHGRARHDLAPDVNSSLGVYALAATATDLYLGGDFTAVGGIDQEHFADLAITP